AGDGRCLAASCSPTASTSFLSMKRSDRLPTGFRLRMSGWSIWSSHSNWARAYIKPTGYRAALEGHLTFYWNEMGAWFEEDEQVFVHPRDPYTTVDTVHSSKLKA